ncbi:hypothetical protein EJ04DRAFT_7457 [Polyplosphaeria fusca]|uniref:Uncharacterized protein n=1 Tax=Polyplosphaeria fusca TaxID=682080 RepID=A0A9P4R8N2_9PLEO|nr:hypothetical protein EJ04DRAFT_7457 [Polyplosphaeria fusca]
MPPQTPHTFKPSFSHMGHWAIESHQPLSLSKEQRSPVYDMDLAPHPDTARMSSRDTASLLRDYVSVSSRLSTSPSPMQRWLEESLDEEPWRPYPSSHKGAASPPLNRGRSVSRAKATCGHSAGRSDSPESRDGG